MKKHKILVTGAEGGLGRTIIQQLKDERLEFIPLVKKRTKNIEKAIKCDVTNFNLLNKIIKEYKPTVIIHLAGITGNLECEQNHEKTFSVNVLGTYNILKCCTKIKPKVIFASSREVYGNTNHKISENNKLKPINVNGLTKMISEKLILNFYQTHKISYTILRFTNFYGENYSKRGISKMIKAAIKKQPITIFGGKQQIDLIHHEDAASAIIQSIKTKKSGIYNIGNGKSYSILQLIKEIEKNCKIKIKFKQKPQREFEAKKFQIDISKAKREIKFKPTLDLKYVLKRMNHRWAP